MAYASRTYTPGSSTTTFALTTSGGSPIGYIRESDIAVKVNGTTFTNAASGSNTYQFSGASTVEQPSGGSIVLNAGVAGTVVLERTTAFQDATVVYTAGSTLTSDDLNNADNQIRFSLQEFDDKYAALTSGTGNLDDIGGFLGSGDAWVSNNSKAPTTGAVDGRVDTKIATALTGDVVATAPVTIADNSPSSGKITLAVDAKLTELSTMAQATANALADLTQSEVEILDGITATTAEINYVDGVTSNVQTQLDAKQPLDSELTELATMAGTTASSLADLTQAEVQILDGATLTTTELNYVDGVTSAIQGQIDGKQATSAKLTELATMSTGTSEALADLTQAEVQILDGATLSTTELNVLDGIPGTLTATELGYSDGVTSSIQTQLNAKQPLDAELTTLAGMQSGTSSLLASNTALAATTAEINSVCENRAAETTITDDDAKIPTSGAVVDYVAAQIAPIGGLEVVATEVAFPNSQPASGVVISISDAGGVVVNGSGVSTTGRTVGGSTVTINSFPSSLYSETLAAGVGLMVSSTGSSQTYTYHKLLAKEGDVKQLSDDINDFNERYRVSNGVPSGTDHAGDLYYDTGSDKMLVRNAANNAWEEVQSIGNFYISTLSPAFNGSLEDFTVSNAPTNAQQLLISINGVVQKPNSGTSRPSEGFALNGSTVLFSDPPANGADYFVVVIGSAVNIGTPSNNTVSEAILQNNQVSEEKLKVSNSPTNGQFLSAQNGASGGLTWATVSTDLVSDTSPQLGGDLDVNGHEIVSTSNGHIDINPNGTGNISLKTGVGGTTTLTSGGDVIFPSGVTNALCQWDYSQYQLEFWNNVKASFGSNEEFEIWHDATDNQIKGNSGKIVVSTTAGNSDIEITPHGTGDVVIDGLKYPQADGSAGQVLKTDGSAQLSWMTPSTISFANDANNRIVTGTGSGLNGEANLTFDGTNLQAKQTGDTGQELIFDSNRSAANNILGGITGYWDTDRVADISFRSGADTTNKDDGYITFRTSPSQGSIAERMRILSGGEVAIGGTGYAGQPFSVQTSSVNLGYMQSTGTTRAVMNFVDANSTVGVGYGAIGNNHVFLKDSAEKVRIDSSGNVKINDGDLIIGTAGHGVDFSAHGNAGGMTSELLDDYEEGTWSPDFFYHSSVANVSGQYTKIGRMVYAYFAGTIYSGQSDHQRINNLPFTTVDISGGVGGVARGYQNFDIQNGPIYYVEGNSTRVYFYKDNGQNMSAADCNGLDFRGMVVYTAAS